MKIGFFALTIISKKLRIPSVSRSLFLLVSVSKVLCGVVQIMQDETKESTNCQSTKKRKKFGRLHEVRKKLRLQSHEMGPDCKCRKKCFETLKEEVRKEILRHFNLLLTEDEQNLYLCGLISLVPVATRRPRQPEESAKLRDATFFYIIRAKINDRIEEVSVCRTAFMSIHGITKSKVEHLVRSLKMTGIAPKNKRGKHNTRPRKLSPEVLNIIHDHIKSFPNRSSHYGLRDSLKIYLSEDLNMKKMHKLFEEVHPQVKISYETYRTVLERDFNISFGYPRTDTCSTCDQFMAKKRVLLAEKLNKRDNETKKIERLIEKIELENTVHKSQAEQFYIRKKASKLESKKSKEIEAICFDFSKNLPAPNLSTNDVYYKRQLSIYAFNIHILGNSQSVFYVYPEFVGKKGSDDVASLIHHFVYNFLDEKVKSLYLFCDSCTGQNKNFTIFVSCIIWLT
ncbi:uncharacterized protein [Onthophagus taurus]|uniref:uncharacterized protein n=1 Tax=Onthophagus taurus TaxID=166361 RepID=UPI0039BE4A3C